MLARAMTALLGLAATLSFAPASAQAATDTTGPSLSLPPVSNFIVGQQVADAVDPDGNRSLYFFDGTCSAHERSRVPSLGDQSLCCRLEDGG
jgi:hypothetical protein